MNQEATKDGKFVFVQDWPTEVLPVVRGVLAEMAWLIPDWCREVFISWHPALSDCVADMTVEFGYRRAFLRIAPSFLDNPADERVHCLRHELLHISTSPMSDYALNAFRRLLPEGEKDVMFETLKDGLTECHEGCVQDLAHCLSVKQK